MSLTATDESKSCCELEAVSDAGNVSVHFRKFLWLVAGIIYHLLKKFRK